MTLGFHYIDHTSGNHRRQLWYISQRLSSVLLCCIWLSLVPRLNLRPSAILSVALESWLQLGEVNEILNEIRSRPGSHRCFCFGLALLVSILCIVAQLHLLQLSLLKACIRNLKNIKTP